MDMLVVPKKSFEIAPDMEASYPRVHLSGVPIPECCMSESEVTIVLKGKVVGFSKNEWGNSFELEVHAIGADEQGNMYEEMAEGEM